MFSGIVQGTGKVQKITAKKSYISIEISAPKNFNKKLKKGASISVNGVCLTSLDSGQKTLKFDVINETLSKTNISKLKKGSLVNLERSITASTEIGGHLMSGHIHFSGRVEKNFNKEYKQRSAD
jgi:riboflavin synthase